MYVCMYGCMFVHLLSGMICEDCYKVLFEVIEKRNQGNKIKMSDNI